MQGSGKTLAFAIPIVQSLLHERARLLRGNAKDGDERAASDFGDSQDVAAMAALTSSDSGPLRALVLCPTRELALQVRPDSLHPDYPLKKAWCVSLQPDVPCAWIRSSNCPWATSCPDCLPLNRTAQITVGISAVTPACASAGLPAHPGDRKAVRRLGGRRCRRSVAAEAGMSRSSQVVHRPTSCNACHDLAAVVAACG